MPENAERRAAAQLTESREIVTSRSISTSSPLCCERNMSSFERGEGVPDDGGYTCRCSALSCFVSLPTMRNVGIVFVSASVPRPRSTRRVLSVARKELTYTA
jgi:hypothetical protein